MLEVEGVIADHEIVAGGRDFLVQTWVVSTPRTVVQGGVFERRVGILGDLRNIAAEHRGKASKCQLPTKLQGEESIHTQTPSRVNLYMKLNTTITNLHCSVVQCGLAALPSSPR